MTEIEVLTLARKGLKKPEAFRVNISKRKPCGVPCDNNLHSKTCPGGYTAHVIHKEVLVGGLAWMRLTLGEGASWEEALKKAGKL